MRCFSSSLRAASSVALAPYCFSNKGENNPSFANGSIRFVLELRLLMLGFDRRGLGFLREQLRLKINLAVLVCGFRRFKRQFGVLQLLLHFRTSQLNDHGVGRDVHASQQQPFYDAAAGRRRNYTDFFRYQRSESTSCHHQLTLFNGVDDHGGALDRLRAGLELGQKDADSADRPQRQNDVKHAPDLFITFYRCVTRFVHCHIASKTLLIQTEMTTAPRYIPQARMPALLGNACC